MARFIHINEVVKLPMLGNEDYLMRARGRYLTWSKYVWQDMNMSTIKVARRQFFNINKRTNTIDLPCDSLRICSVNLVDKRGVFYPVYRNDRLHDDLIDIPADKDCACEYKCGYKMCNTIKGYEAVVSVKCDYTPTGTPVEFQCVDRKAVDSNGFFYERLQYPLRVYESGIWTDTVLHTEERKLCKVDVDENGCCCDTESNITNICNSCGISDSQYTPPIGGNASCPPNPGDKTWIYYCNNKMDWFNVQCGGYPNGLRGECDNIYNITELGNRLIFPSNFAFDKVMVRFYADENLNDLQIPFMALDTFIMGLKWWDNRFSDNKSKLQLAEKFGRDYAILKFGLLKDLNRYRIAELAKIFTPQVYIPSYVLGLNNNLFTGYNEENRGDDYILP